jgi:hypothetical protein
MRLLFRDAPRLSEYVLRLVTGIVSLRLVEHETQRDLRQLPGIRSVVLDVWARDANGVLYDLEVQRGNDPKPRRARYYSAAMDIESLDAGEEFAQLPEQMVVFIMEHDPFGEGEATYRYERRRKDGTEFGDGTHVIYVNGDWHGGDALGDLMADFAECDPSRMRTKLLADRVRYFKENEEGVAAMCEVWEEIRQEGIEQGIERGIEQDKLQVLRSLMGKMRLSAERAMELIDVPEDERPRYQALLEG